MNELHILIAWKPVSGTHQQQESGSRPSSLTTSHILIPEDGNSAQVLPRSKPASVGRFRFLPPAHPSNHRDVPMRNRDSDPQEVQSELQILEPQKRQTDAKFNARSLHRFGLEADLLGENGQRTLHEKRTTGLVHSWAVVGVAEVTLRNAAEQSRSAELALAQSYPASRLCGQIKKSRGGGAYGDIRFRKAASVEVSLAS
jgi:hypothetical protein